MTGQQAEQQTLERLGIPPETLPERTRRATELARGASLSGVQDTDRPTTDPADGKTQQGGKERKPRADKGEPAPAAREAMPTPQARFGALYEYTRQDLEKMNKAKEIKEAVFARAKRLREARIAQKAESVLISTRGSRGK